MRAWSVAIALLLIAGGVAATTSSQYSELEESRCWDCHGVGKWSPPMTAPEIAAVTLDDAHLAIRVANSWTHDIQQLVAVVMATDVMQITTTHEDAESVQSGGFVTGGETTKTLSFTPGNFAQGLGIHLATSNAVQTDLTVHAIAPDGTEFLATSTGATTDTIEVDSVDLALSGTGVWKIVVSRPSTVGSADFQLVATSLAEPADGRWTQTHGGPAILPGEARELRFDIAPGTSAEATVDLQVYSVVYYDHAPPTPSIEDLDRLVSSVKLQVQNTDGHLSLAAAPGPEAASEQAPGVGFLALAGVIAALAGVAARRR